MFNQIDHQPSTYNSSPCRVPPIFMAGFIAIVSVGVID